MPFLEIRRHAERTDRADETSALSPAGRAMCQWLVREVGPFALVVSSPLHRAKETAQLVAGRLDAVEPDLLPDLGGATGERMFGAMARLADWAALLDAEPKAREFADSQLAAWARIASRVQRSDRVLAVSHGGIVDLPAVALARRLGVPIDGAALGYCEGIAVQYDGPRPTRLTFLRVPAS